MLTSTLSYLDPPPHTSLPSFFPESTCTTTFLAHHSHQHLSFNGAFLGQDKAGRAQGAFSSDALQAGYLSISHVFSERGGTIAMAQDMVMVLHFFICLYLFVIDSLCSAMLCYTLLCYAMLIGV